MPTPNFTRAVAGTKAVLIDAADTINECGAFNTSEKSALAKAFRGAGSGVTLLLTSDSTANATTTLADVVNGSSVQEFGFFDVKAGKWYEASFNCVMTNGTAANGAKLALKLSGTQTNIKIAGRGTAFSSSTTPVLAEMDTYATIALGSNLFFTLEADVTSPFTFEGKVVFQAVADGRLNIQIAEKDTGSGTAILKAGSTLTVKQLS